jgi:hypothetical protein
MGNLVAKLVFKTGKDKLAVSKTNSLLNIYHSISFRLFISANNINGNNLTRIGDIVKGKKCIMVVNVATK